MSLLGLSGSVDNIWQKEAGDHIAIKAKGKGRQLGVPQISRRLQRRRRILIIFLTRVSTLMIK